MISFFMGNNKKQWVKKLKVNGRKGKGKILKV